MNKTQIKNQADLILSISPKVGRGNTLAPCLTTTMLFHESRGEIDLTC